MAKVGNTYAIYVVGEPMITLGKATLEELKLKLKAYLTNLCCFASKLSRESLALLSNFLLKFKCIISGRLGWK